MTIAAQYAKALYEIKAPGEGTLANLRESLKRRGHEKLLSRIFVEYQKLLQKEERMQHYQKVTPEMRQTDTLLQLYRRLIATK